MAFRDKVVLITGASSGIGAACAVWFAKEGALLALVGRNAEKFKKVAKEIEACGVKTEPLIILADVSTDAERIINETIAKYYRLDVLINNAGFVIRGSIETTKIEDFDAIFATNVRGLLLVTQFAVPHLILSGGNIVNVSSVVGMRAFTNALSYAMSKACVDHFTRCVSLELAGKVRVNSVNPAAIDTDFHINSGCDPKVYPDVLKQMAQYHPIGRVGKSDEVVRAIAFLADDRSGFVTGVTLPVDGGLATKSPFP